MNITGKDVHCIERLLRFVDIGRKLESLRNHVALQLTLDLLDVLFLLAMSERYWKNHPRSEPSSTLLLHFGSWSHSIHREKESLLGVHRKKQTVEIATITSPKYSHFCRFSKTSSLLRGIVPRVCP